MATAPRPAPKAVPKAVPAEAEAEPPRSRRKLVIVIVLALLVLGGAAGGGWYYWQHFMGGNGEAKKAPPPAPPVFVNMDPFTVNLQSETGSEQFLQVSFTLQVGSNADVDAIKVYQPQVRSRILLLLSSKSASEISSVEGKRKLADEIMAQVRKPFAPNAPELKVNDVFFTSFVIQ